MLGFLPSDNEKYLDAYNDAQMVAWITKEHLVMDAFAYILSDEYGEYNYCIPEIMLAGDTADIINKEIWNWCYESALKEQIELEAAGCSIYLYNISYEWAINGDILSLCILQQWSAGCNYYKVYNISISTGETIPRNDILVYTGFSEKEYIDTARRAMGAGYLSYYAFDTNTDISDFSRFHREFLDMTLSRDNIIQATPFINKNGDLCIVSAHYSGAGAEIYYHMYNLEDYEIFPNYDEVINAIMSKDESNSATIWKTLYIDYIENKILSGNCIYDSCAIVYLDEDNIPEIFLRSESAFPGEAILWISGSSVNEENEIGYSDSGNIYYYEKRCLFCTSWLNHGNYSDTVYSLAQGEFSELHRGRIFNSTYEWDALNVTREEYNAFFEASFDRSCANIAVCDMSINHLIETIKNW